MAERITIGRNTKNQLVINKPQVSDFHAVLELHDKEVIIEDLGSSNGTYKNDRRILRSALKPGDKLKLANLVLSYEDLMQKVKDIKKGNDYTTEFLELKNVYEKYKRDVQALKKEQQSKPMLFRILLSFIPVLISFAFSPDYRYIIMIGGSTLVFALTSFVAMGQEKNLDEKRELLADEFQINYVCPKCKTRLGAVSWKVLASQKQCKVCGAVWMKP